LNRSGAFAAALVGTVVFGFGGWQWAVLLLTFFVTSSGLSRAFRKRKQGLDEKFSKGHERDAGQVLGNGGLATLFVLVHVLVPESMLGWLGFAASLAAVNADTWATELGVLNPTAPRMITDLSKRVEKGTSGGISLFGTLASLLGSAVIALPAVLLHPAGMLNGTHFFLITAAGPADKQETEKHPLHTCGTPTVHIRGWGWLDNDRVNFACGLSGALFALSGSLLFGM
jgi:uncharacterized protein (TIGR00297 family)